LPSLYVGVQKLAFFPFFPREVVLYLQRYCGFVSFLPIRKVPVFVLLPSGQTSSDKRSDCARRETSSFFISASSGLLSVSRLQPWQVSFRNGAWFFLGEIGAGSLER